MKQPFVFGHAGFSGTVPNSLSSIVEAARIGVDGVEIDLQCAADGTPVLAHDAVLISSGGKKRRISSLTAEAIASGSFRPAGHDEPPPSLDSVIEACRDANLLVNLDVKDPRAFPAIAESLSRIPNRAGVLVTGCDIKTLQALGRPIEEASFLVNFPRTFGPSVIGSLKRSLDQIVTIGAQGINVQHSLLNEYLLEETRRRFLSVSTWTVDKSHDIERVYGIGVDSITTNDPASVFSCMRSVNAS